MQDATVQSTQPTSQVQPAVAPSSYVATAPAPQAPAPQAAPVAYQVGMNYPQAVPQATTSSPSSPSQYVPQSQPTEQVGNPWESAFNKVVGLLSQPVQSPFQGQQSATTATPQATPANYASPANAPVMPQSAPLTWSPNQTLSPNYSQTSSDLSGQEAQQAHAEVDSAIADYYNLSEESRQVLNAFGPEAPALLNQYAVNLEGLLDQALDWGKTASNLIEGYAKFSVEEHRENLAYNEILTNPDVLSDYTLKFFGPEGPYPVYENEAQLESRGYATSPAAVQTGQLPAPPQAAAAQRPGDVWQSFSEQMQYDPSQAWRILNTADPQSVANKLFVME